MHKHAYTRMYLHTQHYITVHCIALHYITLNTSIQHACMHACMHASYNIRVYVYICIYIHRWQYVRGGNTFGSAPRLSARGSSRRFPGRPAPARELRVGEHGLSFKGSQGLGCMVGIQGSQVKGPYKQHRLRNYMRRP